MRVKQIFEKVKQMIKIIQTFYLGFPLHQAELNLDTHDRVVLADIDFLFIF